MVDVLHFGNGCSSFGNEDYYFDTVNTYTQAAIKYVYGKDKNKEEKDPEWKTAQNFSDEDWKKFCEEEQMEEPSGMNGRYYYDTFLAGPHTGTTATISG